MTSEQRPGAGDDRAATSWPSAKDIGDRIASVEAEVGPFPDRLAKPVGWLLSPELVANLRRILRKYSDPRRWMWLDYQRAHVEDGGIEKERLRPGRWVPIPTRSAATGAAAVAQTSSLAPPPPAVEPERFDEPTVTPPPETTAVDNAWKAEVAYSKRMDPAVATPAIATPGELWFDYAADLGDGVAAMYSSAYLLQADLAVAGATALPPASAVIEARAKDAPISLEVVAPGDGKARLPRGEFLFVGGDTAYHVADRQTIATRVQAPFTWARAHLAAEQKWDARPRRIYGIPGNHDWYDELDGFSRIFRRAEQPDAETAEDPLTQARFESARTVDLIGFDRVQHASYVAIALPHGWRLWGLDIDQPLDERQRRYFRSLCHETPIGLVPPERLILCTPSPPIVFGTKVADDKHDDAMQALGLHDLYAPSTKRDPQPIGACRLDLSGDVHHYARYPAPWAKLRADAGPSVDVTEHTYQAVVSGLGGAFLHPSETTLGSHRAVPATVFPPTNKSRQKVARGTRFTTLLLGGWLRAVPVLLTLLFTWVWLQDGMARSVGDRILKGLHFTGERTLWGHEEPADLHPVDRARLEAFGWKAGVMIAGLGLLVWAFFLARRAAARRAREPDRLTSYWATTWVAGAGLGILIMGPELGEERWRHGLTIDTLVMLLLVVLPIGAGYATYRWLGARIGDRRRGVGALFGAIHVAVQLVTLVLLTRVALVAPVSSGIAAAVYLLANQLVAPALSGATWSSAVRTSVIAAVWLALVAGLWATIIIGADHLAVFPEGRWEHLVVMSVPLAVAMLLGCAHFGWYLAVMSSLGFHNNELGGAARVDCYRQFIRFRVTERELTGYVIGLSDVIPSKRTRRDREAGIDPRHGKHLKPVLLDVFTIRPRQPVSTGHPVFPSRG